LRISDYEAKETPEQTRARIERLLQQGEDLFETSHRTKTGEIRTVLVSIRLTRLKAKLFANCVFQDITERKQAEKEALRHGRIANALLKVAYHLNSELELEKVHRSICEETRTALNMQMSVYLSYDSNTRFFYLTASSGLSEKEDLAFAPQSWADLEIFFKQRDSDVIPDLSSENKFPFTQTLLSHGIRSITYVLVKRDDLPLGILIAGGGEADSAKDSIILLTGLANQAATAVTNAQLYKEARDRLDQVSALRNIDMAITGSLDLRVTFKVILDEVTKILQTDAAAILRLDPSNYTLKYEYWRGFRTEECRDLIIPLGESIGGLVALERQPIIIHDLREGEQGSIQTSFLINEGFLAYYAVPLIAKGTVLGVLEVFHRELIRSNKEWLEFAKILAGQAGIAIDNAELFSRMERSNINLIRAYDATIEGWAHALDLKDEETEEHSKRVTELTLRIAGKMGIKDEELAHIRRGALLHDIGKMGIPDSILLKPGKLTDEEWEIMRKHPVYAFEMLSSIDYLRQALDIPYCHHEKWDGSGYPRGLKGTQIPIAARIFAVVDVYDALSSDRPYRKAWSNKKVIEHIKLNSGTHFDPKVVELILNLMINDEKDAG
jgi:putative nucleotidyltransferase with HDIG domain